MKEWLTIELLKQCNDWYTSLKFYIKWIMCVWGQSFNSPKSNFHIRMCFFLPCIHHTSIWQEYINCSRNGIVHYGRVENLKRKMLPLVRLPRHFFKSICTVPINSIMILARFLVSGNSSSYTGLNTGEYSLQFKTKLR